MGGESPLALTADEMRALGYRTIDLLVDRLAGDPGPVVRAGSPDELRGRLEGPPPEAPRGYDEILATLEHDVLPTSRASRIPATSPSSPARGRGRRARRPDRERAGARRARLVPAVGRVRGRSLDGGAGYGRTRTATVTAVETRLHVLGWQLVHRLAQASPDVSATLERTAKARLRPARA